MHHDFMVGYPPEACNKLFPFFPFFFFSRNATVTIKMSTVLPFPPFLFFFEDPVYTNREASQMPWISRIALKAASRRVFLQQSLYFPQH